MPTAADSFPSSLLSLTDDQLSSLMAAAAPLQVADRRPFLELVAGNLETLPAVGPGSLHVLLREAQAAFLRAKAIDGTADTAKTMSAQNSRPWVRRPGRPRKDDI